MDGIFYHDSPEVTIATNVFVDVPVILKYEDTNLIEVVKNKELGHTTSIPIYHSDGTYLAKITGTRMYLTEYGKKANLRIDKKETVWICKLDKRTLFEVHHQPDTGFHLYAELYTPEGCFVQCNDEPTPHLFDAEGSELKIGGVTMSGCRFKGCKTGIWLRRDGSTSIASS